LFARITTAPDLPPQDGVPTPQRYWAIATIGLAVSLAVMDGAIANIALPTIARDVNASPSASIWVINAYQLAVTLTLLPLASLGEIYGFRRVYRVGLGVFTIASLACALSDSLPTLTAARILQGLGAAGIMSVNSALTRFVYPRSMLGRGMGINALVAAVSSAIGPTVAAGILSVASWKWLFAINVPLGAIAWLIALRSLPATPQSQHRFDIISALLNAATLGLFVISIDGFAHGENAFEVGGELVAAAVAAVFLVQRQLTLPAPLLPVDLLRIKLFRLSVATSVCSFVSQMMAFTALPFYLQTVLGRGETATGLLMTPWPAMTAVLAPIAGRLADRVSAGLLGGVGLAVFAAGLAALALLPAHASTMNIVWRMAVCGAGFGLFQSPNNRAMISSAPPRRSGGASGMLGTARLLGQTTGAALVAVVFSALPADGMGVALFLAAAIAAVAAAVSCLRLRKDN
jgi:DHA2 family multidrug resistance protein-like MFS transporter